MTVRSVKSNASDRKSPGDVGGDVIFNIETEREMGGRWIAEIADIPGVLAYGATEKAAKANAYALALRVIADRVEKSQKSSQSILS
ncbi:MAG TPA: hypothetical protein VII95_07955 [Terriglobales bacterium]|jgi:predicted RNase H-like HicB family nuclease